MVESRFDGRPSCLERAFEIARSGDCRTIKELRDRLKAEGHFDGQLEGPQLIRQLRDLMAEHGGAP